MCVLEFDFIELDDLWDGLLYVFVMNIVYGCGSDCLGCGVEICEFVGG